VPENRDRGIGLNGSVKNGIVAVFINIDTYTSNTCRDGGNTFTPERYRLELNSAHTYTGRQAPSDPHTVSGVFFF